MNGSNVWYLLQARAKPDQPGSAAVANTEQSHASIPSIYLIINIIPTALLVFSILYYFVFVLNYLLVFLLLPSPPTM